MGAGAPCHADGTRTRHRAALSGLHSSPPTTFSAGTFIYLFFFLPLVADFVHYPVK